MVSSLIRSAWPSGTWCRPARQILGTPIAGSVFGLRQKRRAPRRWARKSFSRNRHIAVALVLGVECCARVAARSGSRPRPRSRKRSVATSPTSSVISNPSLLSLATGDRPPGFLKPAEDPVTLYYPVFSPGTRSCLANRCHRRATTLVILHAAEPRHPPPRRRSVRDRAPDCGQPSCPMIAVSINTDMTAPTARTPFFPSEAW